MTLISKRFCVKLTSTTALVAAALLVLPAPEAQAAVVTVNTTGAATQTLIALDDLVVTSTGTITADPGVDISGGVAASTISNDGGINASTTAIYMNAGSLTGALTNTGNITATLTGATSSTAYGIYLTTASSIAGDLTNSGTISATISGSSSTVNLNAYGIYAEAGSSFASITNQTNGTISGTATATGTSSDAAAQGVGLYLNASSVTGAVTNAGTISGSATANTTINEVTASAYGIYATAASTIDSLTNTSTGTISATASGSAGSSSASMTAYGVYLNASNITNALTNAGTISATASGTATSYSASAMAVGVYLTSASSTGQILNSGTVSGSATVNNGTGTYAYAYGYGIRAEGTSVIDSLTNTSTGVISGSATASADTSSVTAQGYGVYLNASTITNALTNAGTISGTATAQTDTDSSAEATAYGLYMSSASSVGSIVNSGSIRATATADSTTDSANAGAYGFYQVGVSIVTGALNNSGTISATATGNSSTFSADATAYGVYLNGVGTDITGGLTNSGTISATATSAGANNGASRAYGIGVISGADISGGLTNSNIISASASGGTSSTAYGVYINAASISGGITNTGTISGADGAIRMEGLTGATPITINGGRIIGDIFDNTITTGRSDTTIGGDFVTEGDITVSDLVVTGGNTLTVSAGNSITVNDMSASAGTFDFEVDSTASFGSLAVTGAGNDVDLTGATITVNVGVGNIAAGDELLIADGVAAATGGPGGVATAVVDNSFLWDFDIIDGTGAVAATDNTEIYLQVSAANTIASSSTTSSNESVGDVIVALSGSTDPQIQAILTSINTATTQEELNDALESAQAALDGGNVAGSLSVTNSSLGITNTRMASLRSGNAQTGIAAGEMTKGVTMWGQFFGSNTEQDERGGVAGYDADNYGVALGFDSEEIVNDTVLGLALSYGNTDVDSKGAGNAKTEIDSYQLTLYAERDLNDRTYVNGMMAYSSHDTETRRDVAALVARGDYNADQFTIRAETGRSYGFKNMTLTPNVMAHYTNYSPDRYTETGAGGANLTVDGDNVGIFELGLGVDAGWEFKNVNGSVMKPEIRANYRYDTIGDKVAMTSSFVGGGSAFDTEGADPAQGTLNLGATINYYSTDNWEFSANYDFEYKSDYTSNSGFLRASYKY